MDIPTVTASGTATCNIYVKTPLASDNYVKAGLIESNQLFQVTKTTPINGHYQIYYKQGLYYVNAKYVNLKLSTEKKPTMQYNAVVTGSDPVNITSEANASSNVEGIVKKDAKLQVVRKNYGNGYYLLHTIQEINIRRRLLRKRKNFGYMIPQHLWNLIT